MTDNAFLQLAGDFPPADRSAWDQAVVKILKGKDHDKTLLNDVEDGIVTQPLYTRADELASQGLPGSAPFVRGGTASGQSTSGWDIRQAHGLATPAKLNELILADLERGVTSIDLMSVGIASVDDLRRVLEGVLLDLAPIGLRAPDSGVGAARMLVEVLNDYDAPNSSFGADLGCDPIGRLADHGTVGEPIGQALASVAELATDTEIALPGTRTVRASGEAFAHAGASAGDELGLMLSSFVAYLRALTNGGLSIDQALAQILVSLTVGTDQFLDVAKLRAARRVLARVAAASGAEQSWSPVLQAVTSISVLTAKDPWVNMLRTTIGTTAAAVGGADMVTTYPFDSLLGQSDTLGLRTARNTQLILQQESNLHRVIDPAGGSWYIEQLTDQVARAAWAAFQEVEGQGGVVAALESGWVQARLAKNWEQRHERIAKRKLPITGVSEFPDIHEKPVEREPWMVVAPPGDPDIEPLPMRRLAAPWEELRADLEAANAQVFLANLGPVATHTARAGFAKNLFEAAGIQALGNDGFATAAEAGQAFSASGAKLAVICGSDGTYADMAADAAAALKSAGAVGVYLAGAPGEHRDAFTAAGIDDFVHLGANVLQVLTTAATLVTGANA